MPVAAQPTLPPTAEGAGRSWAARLLEAQRRGWLTREESWQIVLDAHEAPDPGRVVDTVLAGLQAVYRGPSAEPDVVVIEDLPDAG